MLHPDIQHELFKAALDERVRAANSCGPRQHCFSRPSRAEVRLGAWLAQVRKMSKLRPADDRPVLVRLAQ